MFHKSIFFCLIFPIFKYCFERKKIKKVIYSLICIFPYVNTKEMLNKFLLKFKIIHVTYLIGYYSKRDSYLGILYSYIFLIIILILNKRLKKLKKYSFLKKIFIFSIFINSALFYYGSIAGRLSSFFNIEFLLQDKILKVLKNKIFIKICMILFLIILYKLNIVDRLERKI